MTSSAVSSLSSPDPAIVLIRPQMGENIGAAARAMWNFGWDRMRLTTPRDGWPNPKAVAMASGAGRLLDEAQVFASTAEAIADCHHVFATTARDRDLNKEVLSPEAAMRTAHQMQSEGARVAILFGPERAGLENDDVMRANSLISIPVNPAFPSLNLAQAVLLLGYEWRKSAGMDAPQRPTTSERAAQVEIEALAQHYEDVLDEAGFFFPPDKAEPMKKNVRNLWSRHAFSSAELRIFHGMLRQLRRWRAAATK